MRHPFLTAALEICRTTDGTRAAVTLRNVSASETAYVLEWAVPDAAGDVVAPLFRFAPGARYLGMLAKRDPPTWDDLASLLPGQQRTYLTILERSFSLPTARPLRVCYEAAHDTPAHPSEIWMVTSSEVTIVA